MKSYKQIDLINRIAMLSALGINASDIQAMFNIEKRLNRWFTAECNGEVYRDEETDKTYRVIM